MVLTIIDNDELLFIWSVHISYYGKWCYTEWKVTIKQKKGEKKVVDSDHWRW